MHIFKQVFRIRMTWFFLSSELYIKDTHVNGVKFRGYTNVLKIDLECPEKYIKAYIFFIFQWIEFKF